MGLSMDASGSIPCVGLLHVLDSMNEVGTSRHLTLAKVFGDSQEVGGNCPLVLNGFLDDDRLWEVLLWSLIMDGHGSAVEHLLLAETETVLAWVEVPVILPLFLLAWVEVAVGSLVHVVELGVVVSWISFRIEDFLGVHQALCVHSEGVGALVVDLFFGPVVTSLVALAERLSDVGSVLAFHDVIELVLHAPHVLGLNHFVHVLRGVGLLTVGVVGWEWQLVIGHTVVSLNQSGLINMRFPKLFEVLGSAWASVDMNILSNAVVG